MQKKELHKLRKTDLLTIIYEQQKNIESLKDNIKGLEEQLEDKDKQIKEIGTITEASVKINKIFEVAEAADKYLNSLKKVNELEIQSEMRYITNEEKQRNVNESKFKISDDNIEEKDFNITKSIVEQPIKEEIKIDNKDILNGIENTNEKESQTIEKVESNITLIPVNVALATIMPKFTTRLIMGIKLFFIKIKVSMASKSFRIKSFVRAQRENRKLLKAEHKARKKAKRLSKIENRNAVIAERKARKETKRLSKIEKRNAVIAERKARKETKRLSKIEKRNAVIAKRIAKKEAKRLKKEEKRSALIAKRIARKLKRVEHRRILVTHIKAINDKIKNGIRNIYRGLKVKIDRKKANEEESKKNIQLTAMQLSLEDIETEINKRKKKESKIRFTSTFLFASTVVVAVAIITATSFFRILQVNGNSMEPSLQDGELLITSKFFKFKKGDIVAFYYNDKILIKRVIATEGEIVSMDDDGAISVNGTKLEEDYVSELDYGKCDITFPYKVPENSVFILGDNRKVSLDSRSSSIGCILNDNIIGKINLRVKPFKLF